MTPPGKLQAGDVIDQFKLKDKLHVGGMATLWDVEALQGDHGVPLIMKIPRIKGGEDPATIVGF